MRLPMLSTIAATCLGCATTNSAPPAPPPPTAIACASEWHAQPAGAAPPPEALDKNAIVAGMGSVQPCVRACVVPSPERHHWYSDRTSANFLSVAVTIAKTGQPSAQLLTKDIPKPVSDCIVAAVNKASFPPFTGAPMSFVYPYLIR